MEDYYQDAPDVCAQPASLAATPWRLVEAQ